MTSERGSRAESKNPFVSDRWQTSLYENQMLHRGGLILGQIPHRTELTQVKCPGIARGGWVVLELTGT